MIDEEIRGAGDDYYRHMDADSYARKINTPAKSPEYFQRFHKPLIERAKQRFGTPIRVLDIACGPASELEFLVDDPDVQLLATDISPKILAEAKQRIGERVKFFVSDAGAGVEPGSVEAGILMNAVVYVPVAMLRNMHEALRPGGECAVNFRIFSNEHNLPFYDFCEQQGTVILDKQLIIETGQTPRSFSVKVLDYANFRKEDGEPDLEIQQLGQQTYFKTVKDATEIIRIAGFETVEHSLFNFASPMNVNNQVDVFIVQKPQQ